ncbi:hypothetical protein P167DRAFT_387635 [Morchella conica CCBAS932]|uniref:Uncharacterized protein n=1 Tax=Morchella conica CCBAS932 TaxID=1392247 RepID=A0A3N4KED9_9PEZI|nr:hypothetical protein P167DRAFT_387635 [Morchella conica CCBAS932]
MLFLGLASNLSRRKEEEEAHQPLCETMQLRVYCFFFLFCLLLERRYCPFPPPFSRPKGKRVLPSNSHSGSCRRRGFGLARFVSRTWGLPGPCQQNQAKSGQACQSAFILPTPQRPRVVTVSTLLLLPLQSLMMGSTLFLPLCLENLLYGAIIHLTGPHSFFLFFLSIFYFFLRPSLYFPVGLLSFAVVYTYVGVWAVPRKLLLMQVSFKSRDLGYWIMDLSSHFFSLFDQECFPSTPSPFISM